MSAVACSSSAITFFVLIPVRTALARLSRLYLYVLLQISDTLHLNSCMRYLPHTRSMLLCLCPQHRSYVLSLSIITRRRFRTISLLPSRLFIFVTHSGVVVEEEESRDYLL